MVKDVGYDLKSIMHYKFNAFALDRNEPTIIPDPRYGVKKESLGQRKNLTDLDIQKIVWLYYCASKRLSFSRHKMEVFNSLPNDPKST